jgi:hypothetical protein
MPGLGHHHDVAVQGLRDPPRLRAWIGEVGILLTHHD